MIFGIYTFGDFEIGMGHIYRTIRFARYILKHIEGSKIVFEVLDTREARAVFATLGAPFTVNFHDNGDQPKGSWDILLVDRLDVPISLMRTLKAQSRMLASIDDSGAGRFVAHIAINCLYLPKVSSSNALTESYTGFEYLMLDPDFHRTCITLPPLRWNVRRLLVAQGGTDTHALIPKLIEHLLKILKPHGVEVHALVSAETRSTLQYQRLVGSTPEVFTHYGVEDMPNFLGTFDLAVTGIGMLAFELAALGIPIVMLTGEKKEMETGRLLQEKTGAPLCPLADLSFQTEAIDFACSKILSLISDSNERIRLSTALSSVIDGLGYQRMVEVIIRRYNSLGGEA